MSDQAIFSAEQRALLTAVLNRIIPTDPTFPGAGDLGVATPIERYLADQPAARRLFLDGVVAIELAAWRLADAEFSASSTEQQDNVLANVERALPAFFDQLVSQTYRHYYVNSTAIGLLGLSADAPQPQGRVLPPFDPSLLDQVRARGPIFRKA